MLLIIIILLMIETAIADKGDEEADAVENAVKKFQASMRLPITGQLDAATIAKMAKIKYEKKYKWRKAKSTYAFRNFSPDLPKEEIRDAIKRAFSTWSAVVPLDFREAVPGEKADINVLFAKGEHGDGMSFDGKGGELAHANSGGILHFDDDEQWAYMDPSKIKNSKDYVDFLFEATHEIGHMLGLSHSKVKGPIMYGAYEVDTKIDRYGRYVYPSLLQEDVQRVQAIYGERKTPTSVDVEEGPSADEADNPAAAVTDADAEDNTPNSTPTAPPPRITSTARTVATTTTTTIAKSSDEFAVVHPGSTFLSVEEKQKLCQKNFADYVPSAEEAKLQELVKKVMHLQNVVAFYCKLSSN